MKGTDIYSYYAFGYNYGVLKRNGLNDYGKEKALSLLDGFFENLENLELQVTKVVANDLDNLRQEIRDGEDKSVDKSMSDKIKSALEKLDQTLDAELQLKTAYVLTKKRYPLESLISKQSDLLAAGVFEKLSVTGKRDFRLGCAQIALSQPTGAAFHLMRSLEEQVKVLYFSFKKTKRLERPMWGPMIKELREKRAPKPCEKVLNHLDGIRVHFRNPTQHPEMFYTLDEAQDLLNQTITAINMVHKELSELR